MITAMIAARLIAIKELDTTIVVNEEYPEVGTVTELWIDYVNSITTIVIKSKEKSKTIKTNSTFWAEL